MIKRGKLSRYPMHPRRHAERGEALRARPERTPGEKQRTDCNLLECAHGAPSARGTVFGTTSKRLSVSSSMLFTKYPFGKMVGEDPPAFFVPYELANSSSPEAPTRKRYIFPS